MLAGTWVTACYKSNVTTAERLRVLVGRTTLAFLPIANFLGELLRFWERKIGQSHQHARRDQRPHVSGGRFQHSFRATRVTRGV